MVILKNVGKLTLQKFLLSESVDHVFFIRYFVDIDSTSHEDGAGLEEGQETLQKTTEYHFERAQFLVFVVFIFFR